MSDVAEAAGVSRTTASFVLNGRHAGIPLATQQRVLKAARELEYRPNSSARALATGRTHRIGIVLNTPESFSARDAYFTEVLAGIVSSAPRYDYNLLLHTAHYKDWRALELDILSGSADGVILVGRYASDELTAALLDAEFPTVCTSYSIDHPRCHSVDCDNEMAAFLSIEHLVGLGHRDIAFFYPGHDISWGRERLAGAHRAIEALQLKPENLHLFAWSETERPSLEWCYAAIEFLKTQTPSPTAIVCCEEIRAQRLAELLPENGLRVPEDIAMISFNSTEVSARANPPLTSVSQPLQKIGAAAMEMLVTLIEHSETVERCRRFPVSLDIRESCGYTRRMAAVRVPVGSQQREANLDPGVR